MVKRRTDGSVPNNKSIMMDSVEAELKKILNTLTVKLTYVANRYENIDIVKEADEYCSAYAKQDTFWTYAKFSDYALNKVGLFDNVYKNNKNLIPQQYREELVTYQREWTLANYVEKNNYYRMLNGLPDYGTPGLYLTEPIDNVDITKPIHEMDSTEITILKITKVLDKLIEDNPELKYLNYVDPLKKISIYQSRTTKGFDILYIYKDRTQHGISDNFIKVYKEAKSYILHRFYEDAYKENSPYYDGFIGMFILTTAMQRYISNYFHMMINRDFYNKDIIKMFFKSYSLPFYNDIPLSYLKKVAKNLNRLLIYKATDKVFVDIFKLFDMDNIDIYNYVLFKDPKLDGIGKPIKIYKEVTELGYFIDTETTLIKSNDKSKELLSFNNINKMCLLNNMIQVALLNNGAMQIVIDDSRRNSVTNFTFVKNDKSGKIYEYDTYKNIKYMMPMYNSTGEVICILFVTEDNKMITLYMNNDSIINEVCDLPIEYKGKIINSLYASYYIEDNKIKNVIIAANFSTSTELYLAGNKGLYDGGDINGFKFECKKIFTKNNDKNDPSVQETFTIESVKIGKDYALYITDSGKMFALGKNTNWRFTLIGRDKEFTVFTEVERLYNIKEAHMFDDAAVYIMKDGTVRHTGSLPQLNMPNQPDEAETELMTEFSMIKTFYRFTDNYKEFYMFRTYDDRLLFFNYDYNDEYGALLFNSNNKNNHCSFSFIRDIQISPYNCLITQYNTNKYLSYGGDNSSSKLPFVKTKNLINITNEYSTMRNVELINGEIWFTTENELRLIHNNKVYTHTLFKSNKLNILDMKVYDNKIFIMSGKNVIFIDTENITFNTKELTFESKTVKHSFGNFITYMVSGFDIPVFLSPNGDYYKFDFDTLSFNNTPVNSFKNLTLVESKNGIEIKISNMLNMKGYKIKLPDSDDKSDVVMTSGSNKYRILYKDKDVFKTTDIDLTNSELEEDFRFDRITIVGKLLIIEGDILYYCKLNDIKNNNSVEIRVFDILDGKISKSDKINGNLILYTKNGGLVLFKDFPKSHSLKLQCNILNDYTIIYDTLDTNIKDLTFDDSDLLLLQEKNNTVTYKEDVEKMYDLRFVETSINTKNLNSDLSNSQNWLDYDSVIQDDSLWGGDNEHDEFVRQILDQEFNYVYTKYISVNSRYDLTVLNFELCYMFGLLVDHKDHEKYLRVDIPYLGNMPLFDTIVGLFALTCIKLGLNGELMDTTTKTMSVLGFNFKQDMRYIEKIVTDANLEEIAPEFNIEDVQIVKAPGLFTNGSGIINLYLDNNDVMQNIYNYKWEAKTIEEYNVYKRILEASIYKKYSTDMYRINGKLPKTYLEYIKIKNPKLYSFIIETDEENLIEQIDAILTSLENLLETDDLKYLFMNVPSLSLDSLRKFIYFLVGVFKSYTVELKALNIIYMVDDKRLHNIKMILQVDDWRKDWADFERYVYYDLLVDNKVNKALFDRLKMTTFENPLSLVDYNDWVKLNDIGYNLSTVREVYNSLKYDFSDVFTTMDAVEDIKETLTILFNSIIDVLMETQKDDSGIETYEDVRMIYKFEKNNKLDIINKINYHGSIEFKSKVKFRFINLIYNSTKFNLQDKLKIISAVNTSSTININSNICGDFIDKLHYSNLTVEQNNKIKYKDTNFFIRNE